MQAQTWFDPERPDGTIIATVMDDIALVIDPSNLVMIYGPAGTSTTLDFDDAVVLLAALNEAVGILRTRGASVRADVLTWLQDHDDRAIPRG